ncbi:MAG: hypothetical protein V3V22_07550 [Methylococcales bacterium]
MGLTHDERVACSDLFFIATGERIEPHSWNPKAAELLFRFIHKLKDCSKGFAWITTFPPLPTNTNAPEFLAKVGWYLFQVWEQYKKVENNLEFNARCRDTGKYGRWPTNIKSAIMGMT